MVIGGGGLLTIIAHHDVPQCATQDLEGISSSR